MRVQEAVAVGGDDGLKNTMMWSFSLAMGGLWLCDVEKGDLDMDR